MHMSAYEALLEATIQHLETLKSRGIRHVSVSQEALKSLSLPARPTPDARRRMPETTPKIVTAPTTSTASSICTSGPSASNSEKNAAFMALRDRALACVKCAHLASSRKNVVFGVGNIDADVMF